MECWFIVGCWLRVFNSIDSIRRGAPQTAVKIYRILPTQSVLYCIAMILADGAAEKFPRVDEAEAEATRHVSLDAES